MLAHDLKEHRSFFKVSSVLPGTVFHCLAKRILGENAMIREGNRISSLLSSCWSILVLKLHGFWLIRQYLYNALHHNAYRWRSEVDVCRRHGVRNFFLQNFQVDWIKITSGVGLCPLKRPSFDVRIESLSPTPTLLIWMAVRRSCQ